MWPLTTSTKYLDVFHYRLYEYVLRMREYELMTITPGAINDWRFTCKLDTIFVAIMLDFRDIYENRLIERV